MRRNNDQLQNKAQAANPEAERIRQLEAMIHAQANRIRNLEQVLEAHQIEIPPQQQQPQLPLLQQQIQEPQVQLNPPQQQVQEPQVQLNPPQQQVQAPQLQLGLPPHQVQEPQVQVQQHPVQHAQPAQPELRPNPVSFPTLAQTILFSEQSLDENRYKRVKTRSREGGLLLRTPQSVTSLNRGLRDIDGEINLPDPHPLQKCPRRDSLEEEKSKGDSRGSGQSFVNESKEGSSDSGQAN